MVLPRRQTPGALSIPGMLVLFLPEARRHQQGRGADGEAWEETAACHWCAGRTRGKAAWGRCEPAESMGSVSSPVLGTWLFAPEHPPSSGLLSRTAPESRDPIQAGGSWTLNRSTAQRQVGFGCDGSLTHREAEQGVRSGLGVLVGAFRRSHDGPHLLCLTNDIPMTT